MPDALLDVQLERLENWVTSTNAAVKHNREAAEVQERIRREGEIEARAKKMSPDQIIKEIEAGGAGFSADSEGRILIKGTLMQNARLMIGAQRDRVVGYLRDRERAQNRTQVI